jgi:hypothetical protein
MRLQSNGGRMTVTQKATMPGYKKKVWYSKDAITNIIALSNLIQQCHVTYNSHDQIFVVHREDQGKPNMEFRMHESGLHYFQPGKEAFVFVNTVSGNKERYTQRKLKGQSQPESYMPNLDTHPRGTLNGSSRATKSMIAP